MGKETQKALGRLIEYLHDDERKHWEEAGKPAKHIFLDLVEVMAWAEVSGFINIKRN